MRYNNDDVRRRDRLMDEARALELIKTAEYGFLSMISAEGKPYGILDLSEEEKMNALHLLIAKLSPNDQEIGAKYAQKSFHRVDIIRIDIDEYSAKRKYVKTAD